MFKYLVVIAHAHLLDGIDDNSGNMCAQTGSVTRLERALDDELARLAQELVQKYVASTARPPVIETLTDEQDLVGVDQEVLETNRLTLELSEEVLSPAANDEIAVSDPTLRTQCADLVVLAQESLANMPKISPEMLSQVRTRQRTARPAARTGAAKTVGTLGGDQKEI